jgi:signal transduction histidine kinase
VTAAVVTAAVTASALGVVLSLWATSPAGGSVASVLSGVVVVAFAVVGAVVVAARPDNRIGWIMLAGGTCWSLGNAGADLGYRGLVVQPGSVPDVSGVVVAGSVVRALGWYLVTAALPVYFPDGRLVSPRWRWLSRLLVVVLVAAVVQPVIDPQADNNQLGSWHNPLGVQGAWQALDGLGFLLSLPLSLVVMVGAVAQLVTRWRWGDAFRRQQLTLFAAAAVLPLLAAPLAFATGAGWAFSVAALPLPFAVGFAVLARGLYDLRTAANRTLLWVTLSAVVAGAYALVIVGAGAVLDVRGAVWLPWVAAAVVALTFAPLRDSLQRGVNRITYGRWDEPYDVLAALGQRLEATVDAERLLDDVVLELRALGLDDVALVDTAGRVVAGAETASSGQSLVEVPVSAYGERVGVLRYRPPVGGLRARDRRLLDDLTAHLGGVLHAQRLTSDLRRARESLVLAREEERRRLRRDLHDGLGPALAGHLLRLDVVASALDPGTPVQRDVDNLRRDLRATVLEVRRVVEGLRPPALDELGLVGALREVLGRLAAGLDVSLTSDDLPTLPAAVEVAVFRIVTEAVTNVARHADARHCWITLERTGSGLRATIRDDGRGGAAGAVTGHGLQTMRERAEELRGRLRVVSTDDGTTVVAELPLPEQTRSPLRAVAVPEVAS